MTEPIPLGPFFSKAHSESKLPTEYTPQKIILRQTSIANSGIYSTTTIRLNPTFNLRSCLSATDRGNSRTKRATQCLEEVEVVAVVDAAAEEVEDLMCRGIQVMSLMHDLLSYFQYVFVLCLCALYKSARPHSLGYDR
jgi:hypothetical protein